MNEQLKVTLENIIPLTEARDHFSQIVTEVQKDKLYVLTKGGKPAVAIVDVKYLEHITGGELNTKHIQNEIKKDPEKVGLPSMVEHSAPKTTNQNQGAVSPQKTINPPPGEPKSSPSVKPVEQSAPPIQKPPEPQSIPAPSPKPAGFAVPQEPKSTPPVEDKPPKPIESKPVSPPPVKPLSTPPQNQSPSLSPDLNLSSPLKPAGHEPVKEEQKQVEATQDDSKSQGDDQIDVQFYSDDVDGVFKRDKTKKAPGDKVPPAQYAGESQEEVDDMSID